MDEEQARPTGLRGPPDVSVCMRMPFHRSETSSIGPWLRTVARAADSTLRRVLSANQPEDGVPDYFLLLTDLEASVWPVAWLGYNTRTGLLAVFKPCEGPGRASSAETLLVRLREHVLRRNARLLLKPSGHVGYSLDPGRAFQAALKALEKYITHKKDSTFRFLSE
jgi:hypothetical protein